jgi:hypothetical protein
MKATPRDYGLRVRIHPEGLKITAVNKMRSGTEMQLTFANSRPQTTSFNKDLAPLESNLNVIENIIKKLGPASTMKRDTPLWTNVKSEIILQILEEYQFFSKTIRPDLMRQYIQKQNDLEELTSWTIALISRQNPVKSYNFNGYSIGLTERDESYLMQKAQIISPHHEFLDLTDTEYKNALELMRTDPERAGKDLPEPTIPSGPYIRGARSATRGLLLIYPLDPGPLKIDVTIPVIGLAFSFPDSKKAVKITYKVNNIYWEQEFDSQ